MMRTVQLEQLTEVHSGDLSSSCPKALLLKRQGKTSADAPTALYRGSLADAALDDMHREEAWDEDGVTNAVIYAQKYVEARMIEEGRELTDSVRTNRGDIANEVSRALVAYGRRLGPFFQSCTLIGTQLPVRWTYRDIDFASHLDLLFRDPDGVLWIWDWKWTQNAPTRAYLGRWPQGIMYTLCVSRGSVMVGDKWVEFAEWPQAAWCHLPSFKPYGRATTRGETEYKRGDERPLDAIVMPCGLLEERADDMADQLAAHVEMLRHCIDAGIYPAIPDPQGCKFCHAEEFCSDYSMSRTSYDI